MITWETKEINDKNAWESFLEDTEEKTFLQSWNWGEFQKISGNKVWRLGIFSGEELAAVAFTVKITARRGTFLFVPHGPIINAKLKAQNAKLLRTLLSSLKEIGKKERASFIRIAPIWANTEENSKLFKELGFRQAPIHLHPELSWVLDIRPDEETLFARMRKTSRYLIRQAQKNSEIEVIKSQKEEDLAFFYKIYQETVNRHHFVPFSRDYLKNELAAFGADNQAMVFLGKYQGEVVSAALIVFWSGIGFYHHGASASKYAKIPVSYLLQWEAIKEAKKRGSEFYNFWGISDINNKRHPWFGLSQFKMGFGGEAKAYVKTQDFPLSKRYWLVYLFEILRKKKRHL
ncbi:MAG: hypothetical protein COT34_01925 [Candidatus Nealsonbacteria bacterium CG08_land_8_20_14_0_20_43_11]|uniref:Methicillin resistance protein n=1 Tax=Candidatus Nealsonbacteria bacterium CG08_land_8_20_14_0_20_43_11 TaxID=1974706 RepID=A0A2M6T0C0_9BACT|nr:MAG: hypothetical protein COT34_01925 [Candidatus Nealsonbacteria bacterium CG08_land_8_20_14_0_20_43_11]